MKRFFSEIFNEALDKKELVQASKPAVLIQGRFQPLTLGHTTAAKNLMKKHPGGKLIFGVVRGLGSSENKELNPFSFKEQSKFIKKVFPQAVIMEFKNGFTPDNILEARKKGFEIIAFIAGEDRIKSYKEQLKYFDKIKRENPDFEKPQAVPIGIKRVGDISATKVREAIRNNEEKIFRANMPKALYDEFEFMKKIIK